MFYKIYQNFFFNSILKIDYGNRTVQQKKNFGLTNHLKYFFLEFGYGLFPVQYLVLILIAEGEILCIT